MIVDAVGRNNVVVRHRDANGKRVETTITDFYPYCYVEDESADYVEGAKEQGYKGVFGEPLTKITVRSSDEIRRIKDIGGKTWEANIPYVNQVLAAKVKRGDEPFAPYEHRVWYLDGEWKVSTGEITMLTVYDSFTENLYSWAMLPNGNALNAQQTGVQDFLIDANGNRYDYDTPVLLFNTEKELLQHFVGFMRRQDPDIITGWYVAGADIKQIVKRCQKVGVKAQLMSPYNRLRYDYGDWSQPIVGRNVIDLMQAFPKLWELKNGKLAGYKLDDVAWECLGEKKVELPNGHDTYYTDPVLYLDYNRQDVALLPKLNSLVNAIEYFVAVQHIVQCDIATTPFVTKVFSCLTLCDPEVDFQIPTKPMFDKVKYDAAIVLDAPQGIHHNIGILDVKAMYHSNVNLHNISWDTIYADGLDCGNGVKFRQGERGLLGRTMDKLTVKRNEYKALMKQATTAAEKRKWDAMQFATKSMVASLYGVSGDSKYGMYHPDIASAITYTSRQTLFRLRDECNERGYPVRYGHTDSIFCEVPSPEEGMELVAKINKAMHPIETEFEKWCATMILKRKNRYAGKVTWTDGQYHDPQYYYKGLELKQARMPKAMKQAMDKTLRGILDGADRQQVDSELISLIMKRNEGQLGEDLLQIGKLKMPLSRYKSISGAAAGALWAKEYLGKRYEPGETFLTAIGAGGQYYAFDKLKDLEGVAKIDWSEMTERFIVNKACDIYDLVEWDTQPLWNAHRGIGNVEWL